MHGRGDSGGQTEMEDVFLVERALALSFVADMCLGWVSRCTVHGWS
jgi:hypothetical protein